MNTQEPREPSPQVEPTQGPLNTATAKPLPPTQVGVVVPIRAPVMDGPFEVRTMEELGPNLPVGIIVDGKRVRKFRLRPFRLKEERVLGEIRAKSKGLTMGTFVAQILAQMVQTVGPHSFDTLSEGERRLVIAGLPMADALYMYLYLRYEAMGAEEPVVLRLNCPHCRVLFKFSANLGSLNVRCVPDGTLDLRRKYHLRDPIVIHGKEVSELTMEPLKWGAFERREFSQRDKSAQEVAVIRHSVTGALGVDLNPFMLHESDMDEMTKYDLEGLTRDIEDNGPGPQMVVEAVCQGEHGNDGCEFSFNAAIEWDYDSLFSRASSQSGKRRT